MVIGEIFGGIAKFNKYDVKTLWTGFMLFGDQFVSNYIPMSIKFYVSFN